MKSGKAQQLMDLVRWVVALLVIILISKCHNANVTCMLQIEILCNVYNILVIRIDAEESQNSVHDSDHNMGDPDSGRW